MRRQLTMKPPNMQRNVSSHGFTKKKVSQTILIYRRKLGPQFRWQSDCKGLPKTVISFSTNEKYCNNAQQFLSELLPKYVAPTLKRMNATRCIQEKTKEANLVIYSEQRVIGQWLLIPTQNWRRTLSPAFHRGIAICVLCWGQGQQPPCMKSLKCTYIFTKIHIFIYAMWVAQKSTTCITFVILS